MKQCADCEHRSFGMCLKHHMAIRSMSSCGVARAPKYLTLEDFIEEAKSNMTPNKKMST